MSDEKVWAMDLFEEIVEVEGEGTRDGEVQYKSKI